MKQYIEKKLQVDMDFFKINVTIILILIGGLVSLALKDNFGEKTINIVLFILGCVPLLALFSVSIKLYLKIINDLNKLKRL